MKYDVVVVGSGPAGSMTAQQVAKSGFKVALIEEHKTIGNPVHCAGLVTTRTLDHAGIDKKKIVLSIKALEEQQTKEAVKKYGSKDSGGVLGEILGPLLKKNKSTKTKK